MPPGVPGVWLIPGLAFVARRRRPGRGERDEVVAAERAEGGVGVEPDRGDDDDGVMRFVRDRALDRGVRGRKDRSGPGTLLPVLLIVRPREAQDVAACVRLLEDVRAADEYPMYWPFDPARWLSPRETLCAWVAEADRQVVGHVVLQTVAAGHPDWETAFGSRADELGVVGRLFVDASRRGVGIGGRLLETASSAASQRGLRPVLDVVETRSHAVLLYERRGWRRVLTRPWPVNPAFAHHFYIAPSGS